MNAIRFFAAICIAFGGHAFAQTPAVPAGATPAAAASTAMSEGEVRKVDKDAGKITLRHGPLLNLDMPGMTMVFGVADRKLLEKVAQGDKVRFVADKVGEQFRVTKIEPLN